MEDKYLLTHNFIKNRWKDAVKINNDKDYSLPFPFVPPCVDGLFKCLFYWDTYYTNKGLIADGYIDLAKNNVDDLIYMLKKYGHVPNSNSYPGIKHNSQPPYLHLMVNDVYNATKDENWLKEAYFALKIEYNFWMTERITPLGLNRYYHHPKTETELVEFYDYVSTRLEIAKNISNEQKAKYAHGYNACCEGGLDFSPRYNNEGDNICPIDLNCLLYMMEGNLLNWAKMFDKENVEFFENNKAKRLELINKYMFDKDTGLYFDYNFERKTFGRTDFYYTAQFFPYIAGISKDKAACKKLLSKLEYNYGIASTSPYNDKISYQAAYPFSWPYDNGITFWALTTLNLELETNRVSTKYMDLCANSYVKAGHLWETYNAIKDEIAEKKEYPNKEMLGWTAGIYQWMYYYKMGNKNHEC
ncbi:MAG: alpha,alpha-trehalase [Bacilli bacterium]|nr:alpha,alpha-trehalase [Bacilli bacterium]